MSLGTVKQVPAIKKIKEFSLSKIPQLLKTVKILLSNFLNNYN